MAKAIWKNDAVAGHPAKERDWRRAMSDNVALALLVYTGLQILMTMQAIKHGMPGSVSYIALVVLIVGIIPACRKFEARWMTISDEAAHSDELRADFRRDQALLWLLAIGLPFAITGLFRFVIA